ncbi:nickel ABC transporter permease subunit NikB [Pilimelia terevasa]|uniref:Nickel ABC transporter permease subunit NikB n=1 Tax=Pilimelia terevasa TaxID=53372 RepID=A0A8J3FJP5_9ACTN|nr:ABC transporter permease [Pilimelia terevasa]GGK41814.1 nickel ABC transporter permease subunit NikB [Pilimelia terevasa]
MGRRLLSPARAGLRRLGQAAATLLAGSVLVWALLALAPGDPARRVLEAGNVTNPTAAQVEAKRAELGLTGGPARRYGRWLAGAARGDLGVSWVTGRPVRDELGRRLPATLRLAAAAVGLGAVAALALALLAAAAPGRWPDTAARVLSTGALVVPGFVVGLVVLHVVVLRGADLRVIADGRWATVLLPAATLALAPAAAWSRVLRADLLRAAGSGHVDVARARGASTWWALTRHQLPHALVQFLTVVGTGVAALLGGAPVVETVYTWPGIGAYAVAGIASRDLPVVQGYALLAIAAYVAVSLSVDLAAAALDPRVAERRR